MFDFDRVRGGYRLWHDHYWSVPTLVGEAPSQHSDPARPFFSASGVRLAEWAGMSGFEELERRAFLKNVLSEWPGRGNRGEKGSAFPMRAAREAAASMRTSRVVVLVGARVARAFSFELHGNPFRWGVLSRQRKGPNGKLLTYGAYIPHPSGTNRFYDDPANRKKAARFLRSVFAVPEEIDPR